MHYHIESGVNLGGEPFKIDLNFDNLNFSGSSQTSRYLQFGEQEKALASLVITNVTSRVFQIKNWKSVICSNNNVLKVDKDNRKNKSSNPENELLNRLKDEFDLFIDKIARTEEEFSSCKVNDDTWYSIVKYSVPNTFISIYVVDNMSRNIKEQLQHNPVLITDKEQYNVFKPVIVKADIDIYSGQYVSDGVDVNLGLSVITEGNFGSESIECLDLLGTFVQEE